MKKIKFRGKDILTGEMLFGDLLHADSQLLILPFGTKQAKTVDKYSVAQLVGYDADGKEIYEGDELIDEDESPINSLYVGIVDSDSNAIDGEIGTRFSDVWIKKERGGNAKADF